MTEQREPYLTILAEFVATGQALQAEINALGCGPKPDPAKQLTELETTRTELLEAIEHLEERHRQTIRQLNQLKESAWSVLSVNQALSDDEESDRFELALRHLAALVDFPKWW